MRKQTRIFFLFALSAMLCTGCAKTTNNQILNNEIVQDKVVNLTVWGGVKDQEILNDMVNSFKEQYGEDIQFNITVDVESEGSCKERILEDVSMAADVFIFVDDQLLSLAAAGVLAPIENSEEIRKNNIEASVKAVTINNELYAFPLTADNGYFMFYNKKYFSDEDVKTLDRMLEVAAKNEKKLSMDWSDWYLYSFFGSTGLYVELNKDGLTNSCNWNAVDTEIKGIDVAKSLMSIAQNKGFINAGDAVFLEGAKDDSIIAGISGIWMENNLKEVWKENYGAVKLPTYTCAGRQIQMASFAGYKMVGVNDHSANKEWAVKLAEWISNEENQTYRLVKSAQGPSNINASKSKEVNNSQALKALLTQSEFASPQRVGANYWGPIGEFAQEIYNGQISENQLQTKLDRVVEQITAPIVFD